MSNKHFLLTASYLNWSSLRGGSGGSVPTMVTVCVSSGSTQHSPILLSSKALGNVELFPKLPAVQTSGGISADFRLQESPIIYNNLDMTAHKNGKNSVGCSRRNLSFLCPLLTVRRPSIASSLGSLTTTESSTLNKTQMQSPSNPNEMAGLLSSSIMHYSCFLLISFSSSHFSNHSFCLLMNIFLPC